MSRDSGKKSEAVNFHPVHAQGNFALGGNYFLRNLDVVVYNRRGGFATSRLSFQRTDVWSENLLGNLDVFGGNGVIRYRVNS